MKRGFKWRVQGLFKPAYCMRSSRGVGSKMMVFLNPGDSEPAGIGYSAQEAWKMAWLSDRVQEAYKRTGKA